MKLCSVSENAAIQRINRRLDDERVRKCGFNSRDYPNLGRFYAVNDRNNITAKDIDLEEWARDLGALHPRESIALE